MRNSRRRRVESRAGVASAVAIGARIPGTAIAVRDPMRCGRHLVLVALLGACWPSPLAAQATSPLGVSFRADIAPSDAGTSAVVGGVLAYSVHDRIALEGEVTYAAGARWSTGLVVTGSVLIAIGPGNWTQTTVPYVAAGVGYQRASVVLSDSRLLGPIPAGIQAGARFCAAPGDDIGPGPGGSACSTDPQVGHWGVRDLPEFYAARLGLIEVPPSRRWNDRTFHDPAVTFGAGVRIGTRHRLFLQPETRVWIAIAEGRTRISALVGIAAGYRF
jgi:hypothetical protein